MTPSEHPFDGGPFEEPWQAKAFALVVQLNREGAFTWTEWAQALSRALAALGEDDGGRYYEAWLSALEALTTEKGLTETLELAATKDAWRGAYQATPHGLPVHLAQPERTRST